MELRKMDNDELLRALLDGVDGTGQPYDLPPKTREAFTRWRLQARSSIGLTLPQQRWLRDVAVQKGLIGDPGAANLFSAMSPKKQAEQRARAAKVKLPWEK